MDILNHISNFNQCSKIHCPYCQDNKVWRHGRYFRFYQGPDTINGSSSNIRISVARYKCRNSDCKRWNRTFSSRPFPIWGFVDISVLFLLRLVFTLKNLSWSKLISKTGFCYSNLRRWKIKANRLSEWLKSTRLLSEPGISWLSFQYHYYQSFYQKVFGIQDST